MRHTPANEMRHTPANEMRHTPANEMRQYSAVSTNSAASSPQLATLISGGAVTLTLTTKPSFIAKEVKRGRVSLVSEMAVGEQGCKRYTLIVGKDDELRIRRLECRPLSLSVETRISEETENSLNTIVRSWASRFFHVNSDSCITEVYNDPECTLFYPCAGGEYIYVTEHEKSLIDINLNKLIGKEIISTHPLAEVALDEVMIPTAQKLGGICVFDTEVRNSISEYSMTDTLRGVAGAITLLDEYGDMRVEKRDPRLPLIRELCIAWSIDFEDTHDGLYIYEGQLNPIAIRDAVREILLNHPPMLRTTNRDIVSTTSLGEYSRDIRSWGTITSIPVWSLKDMLQDTSRLKDTLPEVEIVVDATGAMAMYPDGSKELIRVRQRPESEEHLLLLRELCGKAWAQGMFMSRWGRHLWEYYGVRSIFFTRTPPVFDTTREAIAYLEGIVH